MADFILVLLVIILLFSFFRRYILFFILKAVSERLFNKMNQQHYRPSRPEGSMTIDTKNAAKTKRKDNGDGEFVDFEEIK